MDGALPGIIHPVVLISAYAVLWFFSLLAILPVGLGAVDPETGAPLRPNIKWKMLCATVMAALLWLAFYLAIRAGWLDL
jgi:predicted secreted protein